MPSSVGSVFGVRLLLAGHLGALLLVTGRVGVLGAELRTERRNGGSAIRPRPGSLRGKGQRITGISWQASRNGDKLMAVTGTERIESATEPALAVGEQEAWKWALRENVAEWRTRSSEGLPAGRRRVLYSSDSSVEDTPAPTTPSAEETPGPTTSSAEETLEPTALSAGETPGPTASSTGETPGPTTSSAGETPALVAASAGETNAPVAPPVTTPATATLTEPTVSPTTEFTAEPTPGVSAEPPAMGHGVPPESSPTIEPTASAPFITLAPGTPTTATPVLAQSSSIVEAPEEDAPTTYVPSGAPIFVPEGSNSPENSSVTPVAAPQEGVLLATPAPLSVSSSPPPEIPTEPTSGPAAEGPTTSPVGAHRSASPAFVSSSPLLTPAPALVTEPTTRPATESALTTSPASVESSAPAATPTALPVAPASPTTATSYPRLVGPSASPFDQPITPPTDGSMQPVATPAPAPMTLTTLSPAAESATEPSLTTPTQPPATASTVKTPPPVMGSTEAPLAGVAPFAAGTTGAPVTREASAPPALAPTPSLEPTTEPATESALTTSPASAEPSAPAAAPPALPVAPVSPAMATPGPLLVDPSASPFDQPVTRPTYSPLQPVATPAPAPMTATSTRSPAGPPTTLEPSLMTQTWPPAAPPTTKPPLVTVPTEAPLADVPPFAAGSSPPALAPTVPSLAPASAPALPTMAPVTVSPLSPGTPAPTSDGETLEPVTPVTSKPVDSLTGPLTTQPPPTSPTTFPVSSTPQTSIDPIPPTLLTNQPPVLPTPVPAPTPPEPEPATAAPAAQPVIVITPTAPPSLPTVFPSTPRTKQPATVPTEDTLPPVTVAAPTTTQPVAVAPPSVAPIAQPSSQPVIAWTPPAPETRTQRPTIAAPTTVEVVPGTTSAPIDVAMPLASGTTLPPDVAPITQLAPSIQPVVGQQPSATPEETPPVAAPAAAPVSAPTATPPSSPTVLIGAPEEPAEPTSEEMPPTAPESTPVAEPDLPTAASPVAEEVPVLGQPSVASPASPAQAPVATPTTAQPTSPVETPANTPIEASPPVPSTPAPEAPATAVDEEQPLEAPAAEPAARTEEAPPVLAPAAAAPLSPTAPAEAPEERVAPASEELPPPAPDSTPAAEPDSPTAASQVPGKAVPAPVETPAQTPMAAPAATPPVQEVASPVDTPANAPIEAPSTGYGVVTEPAAPVMQEVPAPAPVQQSAPTELVAEAPVAADPVDSPLPVEAPVEVIPRAEPAPAAAQDAPVPVVEQQPSEQAAVEAPTNTEEVSPVASPEAATPGSPTVQAGTPEEPGAPISRDLPPSIPDSPSTVEPDKPTTASPTTVVVPGTVAAGAVSALAIGAAVVAALGTAASSGGGGGGGGGTDPVAGNAAANANQNAPRAPSAILGAVAVSQLQFLATLSLVDNTGGEDSSLPGFADSFRWVNLWPPASFAEEFISTSEDSGQTRRLQAETEQGGGSALQCSWDGADVNGLGALVFIGNLSLFCGALLLVFLLHVALVSAVEAFWLAKKRAKKEVIRARRRGIPVGEHIYGPRDEQPRVPEPDANPSGAGATNHSVTTFSRSQKRPRKAPSFLGAAATGTSHRRLTNVPSLNAATSMHRVRPRVGGDGERKEEDGSDGYDDGSASETDCSDEEEGGRRRRQVFSRAESRLSPVAECREHSTSAWLHFPHVELVVLFFAFEGAVASQVSALREGGCPSVMIAAGVALFLYPVLMFAGVLRTYFVRVRTKTLIVFTPNVVDNDAGAGDGAEEATNAPRSSFFSRVKAGLVEDNSMFAWANKGEWETAETGDEGTRREGQWFLIGFEPLFVDFTQSGAWFVAFTLVEWILLGCIGALVDESVLQLSLFCGLHTLSFLILVILKPLANSVINVMAAGLMAVDATCMALLAISARRWEGTTEAARVDSAVMLLQLLALCALIIPIYVDTSLVLLGAIRSRMRKSTEQNRPDARTEAYAQEHRFIRHYIRRAWLPTWCTMLGNNVFACARDTREGVRPPRSSPLAGDYLAGPAARTGPKDPYPHCRSK